jgi:FlaG/FlaF family flagellin (archaellin)
MTASLPFSFFQRMNEFRISRLTLVGKRSREGVSPVIATTIILAITVTMGLALWSFANSGVSTATTQYADVVTDYGKFAADKFVILSVAFDYPNPPDSNDLTLWLYNSGTSSTTIQSVIVSCKDCATPMSTITLTAGDLISGDPMIPSKSNVTALSFDASAQGAVFNPGDTYQVQVVTKTGASQTVYQKE